MYELAIQALLANNPEQAIREINRAMELRVERHKQPHLPLEDEVETVDFMANRGWVA